MKASCDFHEFFRVCHQFDNRSRLAIKCNLVQVAKGHETGILAAHVVQGLIDSSAEVIVEITEAEHSLQHSAHVLTQIHT